MRLLCACVAIACCVGWDGVRAQQSATPLAADLSGRVVHLAPAVVPYGAAPSGGCVRFAVSLNAAGTVLSAQALSGPDALREPERSAVLQSTFLSPVQNDPSAPAQGTVLRCALFTDNGTDVAAAAVWLSSGVAAAQTLHKVAPVLPASAKQARISGATVLQIVIDTSGSVVYSHPISGPEALYESVVQAVGQWKYKPLTLNGEVVSVLTTATITVQFGVR